MRWKRVGSQLRTNEWRVALTLWELVPVYDVWLPCMVRNTACQIHEVPERQPQLHEALRLLVYEALRGLQLLVYEA